MTATIRLTVLTGPHKGTRFCMRELASCVMGRAPECQMQLCGAQRDQCISRRHCQLYFAPPFLCVRDLGSANGTYINGHNVTEEGPVCCDVPDLGKALGVASDGDILTVGGTTFQVNILNCPSTCPNPPGGALWQESEVVKKDCPVKC